MTVPSPLTASALVFAGGGVGAVLRYQTGRAMSAAFGPAALTAFPWATLAVNVAGSLAMGLLAGWLARFGTGGETWRLLVGVGLLGGFIGLVLGGVVVLIANEAGRASGTVLFELTPGTALAAILFSTILGAVAGFVPALHAARLDPVTALRYE